MLIPFSKNYELINLIRIDYKKQVNELKELKDNLIRSEEKYNYINQTNIEYEYCWNPMQKIYGMQYNVDIIKISCLR